MKPIIHHWSKSLKKNIAEAPARFQRLPLRYLKFDIEVKYKRGDSIPVADGLSRVYPTKPIRDKAEYDYVHFLTVKTCPINISCIKEATLGDPTMNLLKNTIYCGWPAYKRQCPPQLWDYWNYRCDLVLGDCVILKGDRVIVPSRESARNPPCRPSGRNKVLTSCQTISVLAQYDQ